MSWDQADAANDNITPIMANAILKFIFKFVDFFVLKFIKLDKNSKNEPLFIAESGM